MTFEFKSFEHFKQMRIKAAQWRAFDKQLRGAEGEELIRGVLQEPVVDNRTDQTYEKRLYQGFKEGMQRLREGIPLVNNEPPEPPKDQFRAACRSLGYLPASPRASQLPPSRRAQPPSSPPQSPPPSPPRAQPPSSPPRASPPSPPPRASPPSPPLSSWSPPVPLLYPSTMFQRTPSPPASPSSMTSSVALLRTTPTSPPPVKTPTRIYSPSLSTASWSPTPPPTPRDSEFPAYPEYSSSEDDVWYPLTPSPMRRESASSQPAIAKEAENQTKNATTPKETKKKSTPKRKRRKQQLKFSDEALKQVRPSPPATRRSKSKSATHR